MLENLELPDEWNDNNLNNEWSKILEIKNAFTFAVEQKRNKKEIKSSLEASAFVYLKDNEYKKISENQNLSEILISANIEISEDYDDQFLLTQIIRKLE